MTYTDPRIPTLTLPDDGSPNPDDTVDVTQQLSNNFNILASVAGIYHVANFGALPTLNNFTGRLAMTDDTGTVYQFNGGWILDHDTKWQTYTPTWTNSNGGTLILGTAGYLAGKYFRVGKKCKLHFEHKFGTGAIAGGTPGGVWSWTLPVAAAPAAYNNTTGIVDSGSGYASSGASSFTSCFSFVVDANTLNIYVCSSATSPKMDVIGGSIGPLGAGGWTNNGEIRAFFEYEMA